MLPLIWLLKSLIVSETHCVHKQAVAMLCCHARPYYPIHVWPPGVVVTPTLIQGNSRTGQLTSSDMALKLNQWDWNTQMRTAFKSKAIFIPLEALCLN